MAKISTYPHASSPQLSDMLIGSEVGDGNATKNFLISDIIGLIDFGPYVPYTGAVADVDITGYDLTADHVYADITANVATINSNFTMLSGLAEFYGTLQAIGAVVLDAQLIDGLGSPGTNGQVLTTNGSGTIWATYGLQEVLDAGNSATGNINLTGSITATRLISSNGFEVSTGLSEFYGNVQMYSDLTLDGAFNDATTSPGTAGQVLTSRVTGT